MEWLFQNPIANMYGPHFLGFYGGVILFLCIFAFANLKENIQKDPKNTTINSLVVGVFGLAVLNKTPYNYYKKMFQQSTTDFIAGCGSGGGGCS